MRIGHDLLQLLEPRQGLRGLHDDVRSRYGLHGSHTADVSVRLFRQHRGMFCTASGVACDTK
jgi:hypothetical protein